MNLEEFLGVSTESARAEATAPEAPEVEPKGVVTSTTPNGYELYFQAAPKRLYRIRADDETAEDGWAEVDSVTKILDVLHKPALVWWGMKVGVEGLITLHNEYGRDLLVGDSVDDIVDLLTKNKLTVNHVVSKAADRGSSVHDALEFWAREEVFPHVEVYAPEEQPYVKGLLDFLVDSGAEPLASEVMVGSVLHGYAGRFDLLARIPNGAEVVTRHYPKKKDKRERVEGGVYLLDLKTSKGVYDSHFMQLEAYEWAALECGYEPSDFRGVIHATEDGGYELVKSRATFDDFLAVKGAHDAVERLKKVKA